MFVPKGKEAVQVITKLLSIGSFKVQSTNLPWKLKMDLLVHLMLFSSDTCTDVNAAVAGVHVSIFSPLLWSI